MSGEQTSRAVRTALTNARVVTPEGLIDGGYVIIEDGEIADVGRGGARSVGRAIDAEQNLVVPGFVDIHGDDLERYRFPRTGADVGVESALVSCDRGNVTAGITTKFHAVAFEHAPDEHRSIDEAREATGAVDETDGFLANTFVNARCELGDRRAVDAVTDVLDRDVVGLVSLMNHLPDCGQFADEEQFERRYGARAASGRREGVDVRGRRRRVNTHRGDERVRRLVRACHHSGIPVASHDDETPAEVDAMADLAIAISEYPVTKSAARRAKARGLVTAMGAPNLVRGGSLWDNLSAAEAIRSGLVDVLCSDFHPRSLLEAVLVDTGEPIHERVARVTSAPAKAVGLEDRGRIEPGARADIVVVATGTPPRVRRAFVGGTEVLRTGTGG